MRLCCVNAGGRLEPFPRFFVLLLLLLLLIASAADARWQGYAQLDAMAYSEPVNLQAARNSWRDGQFAGGERQWAYLWSEVGVRTPHWALGALYRDEADLRFAAESAEFYYRVRNRLPLPEGQEYALEAQGARFRLHGLRAAGYLRPFEGLQLGLGLSVFQAGELQEGKLSGTAMALSAMDYAYAGGVDYRYAEDKLLSREVAAPMGYGFAVDAELLWQRPDAFDLALRVVDLPGVIGWREVPYTTARINSQRRRYDDDGFVRVDPVLRGFEGHERRYTQRLTPRYQARLALPLWAGGGPAGELLCQFGHCLYGVGMAGHGARLLYWPQFGGVSLRLGGQRFYLDVSADGLPSDELQLLRLSFGLSVP